MKPLLAFALLTLSASARADAWRDTWGWGQDPTRETYERLFDEPYPKKGFDPFNRLHPFHDVQAFNAAFDRRATGVTAHVEAAKDTIALVFAIPGSASQALDVAVDGDQVRVRESSPVAPQASPYRFRSARNGEAIAPVPDGARAGSEKVTREGDVVRVTFARASS